MSRAYVLERKLSGQKYAPFRVAANKKDGGILLDHYSQQSKADKRMKFRLRKYVPDGE